MITSWPDPEEVGELSQRMLKYENPESDVDSRIQEGMEPHLAVQALRSEHGDDGVKGALAYLAEEDEPDVGAVIAWMLSGAYKGRFDDEAAFARDQFEDAIGDLFAGWGKGEEIGFPADLDMCEGQDWEYIGEALANGEDWSFIEIDSGGVHVFDSQIDLDEYRGAVVEVEVIEVEPGPLGTCEWVAVCGEDAVKLIPHPAFPDGVPTCQKHVAFAEGHLPEARRIHEG